MMPKSSRAANNRRKRGGPRSTAGKAVASRNALRHGFAADVNRRSLAPERVERLARAIAGDDADPAVVAAAFKISQNELLLSDIAAHKVWVVERLREPYANAFACKDNSMELARARLLGAWLMEREINARLPALLEKYELRLLLEELAERILAEDASQEANEQLHALFPERAERAAFIRGCLIRMVSNEHERLKACGWRMEIDDIVPIRLKGLMDEPDEPNGFSDAATESGAEERREEYEALEAAVRDLVRLERYEQRAWSRQKRAILELANIRLERRLRQDASPAPA